MIKIAIRILNFFFSFVGVSHRVILVESNGKDVFQFQCSLINKYWQRFICMFTVFYASIMVNHFQEHEHEGHSEEGSESDTLHTTLMIHRQIRISICALIAISILGRNEAFQEFVGCFNELKVPVGVSLCRDLRGVKLLILLAILSSSAFTLASLHQVFAELEITALIADVNWNLFVSQLIAIIGIYLFTMISHGYYYDEIYKYVLIISEAKKEPLPDSQHFLTPTYLHTPNSKILIGKDHLCFSPMNSTFPNLVKNERFLKETTSDMERTMDRMCAKLLKIYKSRQLLNNFVMIPFSCILLYSVYAVILSSYFLLNSDNTMPEDIPSNFCLLMSTASFAALIHSLPVSIINKVSNLPNDSFKNNNFVGFSKSIIDFVTGQINISEYKNFFFCKSSICIQF